MLFGLVSVESLGKCAPQQRAQTSGSVQLSNYQTRENSGEDGLICLQRRSEHSNQKSPKGDFHAYTPPRPRIRARRARHPALRDRNGPGRNHAENLASVSRRHHRQGRFPRPAVPDVRRRSRKAQRRRDRRRNLSELVADQDQRAILGDAQRRARYQPLSDALCRRRIAGDQYRPDARPGLDLRSGPALEDQADRQGADGFPGRQGHHPADLGLAGRRRRQPLAADRRPGRRQGPQGSRRLARDGHGAADRGRRPCCRCRRTKSMRRCRPAPATPASPPPPA